MKTELLYFSNPYLREIQAKIINIKDESLVLDKTIFFGKSCGVKPDTGIICFGTQSIEVIDVQRKGDQVVHVLKNNPGLEVGQVVNLRIDWERRYSMMKLHTTLHILSALIWKKFNALVTGSDITPEKAKIDFDMSRNFTSEELKWIEQEMNKLIKEGHETSSEFLPIAVLKDHPELIRTKSNILPEGLETIRVVTIGTVDRQADGGLHVKTTNEIGKFKIIKHKNKGRGIRRLEVVSKNEES